MSAELDFVVGLDSALLVPQLAGAAVGRGVDDVAEVAAADEVFLSAKAHPKCLPEPLH